MKDFIRFLLGSEIGREPDGTACTLFLWAFSICALAGIIAVINIILAMIAT